MNFRKFLVAAALALAIRSPLFAKNVTNGAIAFESSSTPKKPLKLNGDWEFYENQTFETLMGARLKVDFIDVPSSWTKKEASKEDQLSNFGSHTYRVVITGLKSNYEYAIFSKRTPCLASKIFSNGRLLAEYGKFARHKQDYKPAVSSLFCAMNSSNDGVIEIVMQVSNYTGGMSGITMPIFFGELDAIEKLQQKFMVADALTLGLLLFCLLSNLFLWMFDKKKLANLLFALLIFFIAVRFAFYNLNPLQIIGITVPFALQFKLETTIAFGACVFSALYVCDKTFFSKHPSVDYVLSGLTFALYILYVCLPIHFAVDLVEIPIIWAGLFGVYSMIRFVFALKNQQILAATYMFFYTITSTPFIVDVLYPELVNIKDFSAAEIFIPIMTLFDIAYISAVMEIQQRKNRSLKNELSKFYFGYRRFLPRNALRLFENKNISDMKIGLSTESKKTIMFVGIAIVSPDNTKINLREEFETLAFYCSTIIEKIHLFNGTVITITNQGISALFEDGDSSSLEAARAIRNELQTINSRRAEDYYLCATFNISLHNGDLLIGFIGDRNRLDLTTISSGIEVIDKMRSLGFAMNIPILISQPAAESYPEEAKRDLKLLGNIHFSEFTRPIGIYGLPSSEEEENSLETIDETPFITQREADKYINF
ncbi:MAG: hypothetical protein J6V90_09870 [Treponema sp.]|nr:hypothetical protein [Treponema sp.]